MHQDTDALLPQNINRVTNALMLSAMSYQHVKVQTFQYLNALRYLPIRHLDASTYGRIGAAALRYQQR